MEIGGGAIDDDVESLVVVVGGEEGEGEVAEEEEVAAVGASSSRRGRGEQTPTRPWLVSTTSDPGSDVSLGLLLVLPPPPPSPPENEFDDDDDTTSIPAALPTGGWTTVGPVVLALVDQWTSNTNNLLPAANTIRCAPVLSSLMWHMPL